MKKIFTKKNVAAIKAALETKGYNVLIENESKNTIMTISKVGGIIAKMSEIDVTSEAGNVYRAIAFESVDHNYNIRVNNYKAETCIESIDAEYTLATLYHEEKDVDEFKDIESCLRYTQCREEAIIKSCALYRLHKLLKQQVDIELFNVDYRESKFYVLSNNDMTGSDIEDIIEEDEEGLYYPLYSANESESDNHFLYCVYA